MSTPPSKPDSLATYFGYGEDGESPAERKLQELKRRNTRRRLLTALGLLTTAALFYASLLVIEFNLSELVGQVGQFYDALTEYFPPTTYFGVPFVDLGTYADFIIEENLILAIEGGQIVWGAMFVTMAVAFAGTVLGLPLALFFGVMSSERVVPYPFNFLFRGTMSLIRAIPGLVWFIILIPLAGVTPFTGALAIMVDTTGYLGRLFTDELEEIGAGPIEGIRSTGASRSQIVSFGMLSQVFRQFIAWIAFDLEHNVRAAIGLGIIGGGGLGLELYIQRQTFNYTNMMACIILIFVLAASVELVSQRVRSALREDDDIEKSGVIEAVVNAPKNILASSMGRRGK